MHAAGQDRLTALADLATRLKAQRPGLAVVITAEAPAAGQAPHRGSDPVLTIWPDHPALARRFLDHWRPSMCLWAGGDLMPNLIIESAEAAVPLVLIDIGPEDMPSPRRRFMPAGR